MIHKSWRIFALCSISAISLSLHTGCGRQTTHSDTNITQEVMTEPVSVFSIENYLQKKSPDRISISECAKNYPKEIDDVRNLEYQNLNFKNCRFADFPKIDQIELLSGTEHGITVQESWDIIENWLKEIEKDAAVDMKKDVLVVSEQLGLDENGNYFTFYDHMDELDSGSGAHITNNQCHIQLLGNGIYSMSDGKITEYLGLSTKANRDAMGANSENIVESGSVEELGPKKYVLADGELTIREGAELVRSYFEQGTPFPCADGVTVDVPQVTVFHLGDVFGYNYRVRRLYHSMPFANLDFGTRNFNDAAASSIAFDTKHAYVIDHSGVTAFVGYNESEKLDIAATDDKILSFRQSADNISRNLASYLKIEAESAELAYLPMKFADEKGNETRIIFPCWQITGINTAKSEHIQIYSDVLTGEIYYCTYL